jgi:hypothetical protein
LKSRFTYIGSTVIEVIVDGDSVTVNMMPAETVPDALPMPDVDEPQPELAPVDAPLAAAPPLTIAAPPAKKKRTLMGAVRAGWFVLFTAAGESLTYALNNLTSLDLPPGTATAIGAVGYGLKRALFPDTTL